MTKASIVELGPARIVSLPNITVAHGLSTRVGGVSSGHWASFNAGFTVGDEAAKVWENRRRFAELLGVENLPWLLSMTHGTRVVRVEQLAPLPSDRSKRPITHYEADACITNKPGIPLSLTVADCVPVFFHDPVVGAIGLAHAGWRGTVGGIVAKTVNAMQSHYGSSAKDIQVGIGPSIGPTAFEVGPEVAEEFRKEFAADDGVVLPHPDPCGHSEGKAYVDLWTANQKMALRAGVPSANVSVSGWCTASHPDLFFSHRRDLGKTGRLLAGIILS